MITTLPKELISVTKSNSFDTNIKEYSDEFVEKHFSDEAIDLPNQFSYIARATDYKFVHVSSRVEGITGLKENEFDRFTLVGNIHPDDLNIFIEASVYSLEASFSEKDKHSKFTSIINFRWKKKDGTYTHFLKYSFIIKTDNNGRAIYYKSIIIDISSHKTDSHITAKLLRNDVIIFNINNHSKSKTDILSKRELEVAKLISGNYSTPQIAEKLSVSKHTIDSHRKNIVRKLELKNTRELFSIMALG